MNNQLNFDHSLLEPHFSTQVYKAYLTYIKNTIGLEEAKILIEKSGLNWDYLQNTSNWVSETFAEKFYNVILTDPRISKNFSYESGKLAMSKEMMGGAHLIAMQILDPKLIFKQIPFFASKLNKVDKVEIIHTSKNAVKLNLKIGRHTEYIDQIVQNWIGYLEHIPTMFGYEKANSNITVKENNDIDISLVWVVRYNLPFIRKVRAYSFISILISLIIYLIQSKNTYNSNISLISGVLSLMVFIISSSFFVLKKRKAFNGNKKNLVNLLHETEERYKDLLNKKVELDRKYKESKILSEVLQRINKSNSDPNEIIKITLNEIKQSLKYDRVLYMSNNELTNELETHSMIGFDNKMTSVLFNYKIDLNQITNEEFHLGNIFKNKKSFLLPVTKDYFSSLSEEGKSILVFVKSKSFLAVPVYSDKSGFGVLLVDYYITSKVLNNEDLEFIQCVSNQLGITLENIKSYNKEIQIREAFQKFVPDEVVKSMLGENKLDLVNGIQTEGTIIFSDLRGFTANSEILGAEFMVNIMNYYFKEMSKIIYKNNGIIERLMGDGMLALFNAFKNDRDHAIHAYQASLDMQNMMSTINSEINSRVKLLNKVWKPFELGIAVNSGPFIVGNIGTEGKTEFTSFGETVNTTARICEISKQYGNCILISGNSEKYNLLIQGIDIGEVNIRGSNKKIKIILQKIMNEYDQNKVA